VLLSHAASACLSVSLGCSFATLTDIEWVLCPPHCVFHSEMWPKQQQPSVVAALRLMRVHTSCTALGSVAQRLKLDHPAINSCIEVLGVCAGVSVQGGGSVCVGGGRVVHVTCSLCTWCHPRESVQHILSSTATAAIAFRSPAPLPQCG
jgi:hypothetical protein